MPHARTLTVRHTQIDLNFVAALKNRTILTLFLDSVLLESFLFLLLEWADAIIHNSKTSPLFYSTSFFMRMRCLFVRVFCFTRGKSHVIIWLARAWNGELMVVLTLTAFTINASTSTFVWTQANDGLIDLLSPHQASDWARAGLWICKWILITFN